ncbi:MAG: hypothetical protein HY959_06040 [Ignavibacteriae bacterium]|nr:hypothetical protein [Ignavibacteriota bacterium]
MRRIFIIVIVFMLAAEISFPQDFFSGKNTFSLKTDLKKHNPGSKISNMRIQDEFWFGNAMIITAMLINPMLVYENKKVNFGLTKEASVLFPFIRFSKFGTVCRVGAEYSYIFRDERNHHLRSFFSVEIPLEAEDFVALTTGIGGGYFTDFKKSGAFPQVTLGGLLFFDQKFSVNPYIKLRHTFMFDRSQSDVTDLSLGIGIIYMPFFD